MRRIVVLAFVALGSGCSRSSSEGVAGSVAGSATASSSAALVASAVPSASAAAPSGSPRSWQGSYKTAAGALNVPADWAKVHWSSPDTTAGVGDGTIQLTVDPTTHRVSGSLEGVAGPAVVDGTIHDTELSANIVRKDPTDRGFAGTLLGVAAPDQITGTLSLASGDGAKVRTGTFTLAPGPR